MDEEEGQGSLDGYESDRSLDNEAVVRLEDDSETEGDHDDDPSGSRQPVTGRGRHFAVWDDREIDVVVEPFAGNPGYRGQPLGGQGDEDQDDEGEGGNGHRRHVEPIMVWRQFFAEDLIVCLASPPATRTVGSHWPCESTKGRCVECYAQGRTTKYSRMSCEQCGVHLHPECFKVWHLK